MTKTSTVEPLQIIDSKTIESLQVINSNDIEPFEVINSNDIEPFKLIDSKTIEPFQATLSRHGLQIKRDNTVTLQINVGFLCNQICRHCHLDAGPGRTEIMNPETVEAVIAYAKKCRFNTIDITGGAPELNPNINTLITRLAPLTSKLMFRSNLSVLNDGKKDDLIQLLKSCNAAIVASFPSLNESQTNAQRGENIFGKSIETLIKLNKIGYGRAGTGLDLHLVSNPSGAFLPPSQSNTEKRFRELLKKKTGIIFNDFFSFANMPVGRFRQWLVQSGNYNDYMQKLVSAFNPNAVKGLMCRTLVSVSWDGYLYDCDFNQAENLYMTGRKIHVSEMQGLPESDTEICVAEHCYTCTAGAGFT
ncbi:MAG: arsenosugar biosynthesis radical SAM protein ArsS [Desulfamplus sp.]|nr:arsenosugar biosynthesis radical SAM protein ArsS [Desulfamplus sp.]